MKKTWNTPELSVHGSVEELTLEGGVGSPMPTNDKKRRFRKFSESDS